VLGIGLEICDAAEREDSAAVLNIYVLMPIAKSLCVK
jgi:hypothetical protein